MADFNDLNSRFACEGVRFEPGFGGLTRAAIRTAACEADIYLLGAHVTHFQPAGHKPLLFLSARSEFAPGKPIRGGIPVIFPWFGLKEGVGLHGTVRLMNWEVENVRRDGEAVTIVFRLAVDDAVLHYAVTAAATLRATLTIENTGVAPLRCEEALHTYFAVGDARQIEIEGLHDTRFLDKTEDFAEKTQLERQLRLAGETDRVYLETEADSIIHDTANARLIFVNKTNSRTTVVWNPWTAKAAAMPDFGDEEWPQMVCIETCNVMASALEIASGASHEMTLEIGVQAV